MSLDSLQIAIPVIAVQPSIIQKLQETRNFDVTVTPSYIQKGHADRSVGFEVISGEVKEAGMV